MVLCSCLGNADRWTSWRDFLWEMMKRGLRAPVQVTTDGAPESVHAVEEDFFNRLQGVAFQATGGRNIA